jgi:hypothetical protein
MNPMSDEVLSAKPGDVLPIGRFGTMFKVTARTNGHVWGFVVPSILKDTESCAVCGMIRRRDDKNGPCKGPVRIELRKSQ